MKKAFSLVEIGFVLFVLMAIFFTVIPFSVSNLKQVKCITEWKDYITQAEYSFETLLEYKKTSNINVKESVAKFMKYLDAKKVSQDDKRIKHYKYKIMNGNFYQKMNISNFDEMYIDIEGKIIGIEYGEACDKINPCATVWVDINGNKRPNIVGNDIFIYEMYENAVSPYGKGLDYETLKKDCSKKGTGMFCSQYYIIGGE